MMLVVESTLNRKLESEMSLFVEKKITHTHTQTSTTTTKQPKNKGQNHQTTTKQPKNKGQNHQTAKQPKECKTKCMHFLINIVSLVLPPNNTVAQQQNTQKYKTCVCLSQWPQKHAQHLQPHTSTTAIRHLTTYWKYTTLYIIWKNGTNLRAKAAVEVA